MILHFARAAPSCEIAVIVALPGLTALTTAVRLPVLLTVATSSLSEIQTAFLNVAFVGLMVAVSESDPFTSMLAFVLLSVTLVAGTNDFFTVILHVANTSVPSFAVHVMVASPSSAPAINVPAFASTIAIISLLLLVYVTSFTRASSGLIVAFSLPVLVVSTVMLSLSRVIDST